MRRKHLGLLTGTVLVLITGGNVLASAPRPVKRPSGPTWKVIAPARQQPLVHLGTGIGADGSGNVYISDSVEGRVHQFSPSGRLLGLWGSNSPGPTHWYPLDVAASKDSVYVLAPDQEPSQVMLSGHVVRLNVHGRALGQWEVGDAQAIATGGGGNIFAVTPEARTPSGTATIVTKYSSSGAVMATWHTPYLPDEEVKPNGLAVDPRGNVYVSIATVNPSPKAGPFVTSALFRFTPAGAVTRIASRAQLGPVQAVDNQGVIYMALEPPLILPARTGGVQELGPTGRSIRILTGAGGSDFGPRTRLTLYKGHLFLVDAHNLFATSGWADTSVLDVLTPNGRLLQHWGKFLSPATLPLGQALTVDAKGTLWAVSRKSAFMSVGSRGSPIRYYGSSPVSAQGIGRDSRGDVYLSFPSPGRILKYGPNGRLLSRWRPAAWKFMPLSGLAVGPHDDVYAITGNSVTKLSAAGRILQTFATAASSIGQLAAPQALAVDRGGNIYVADTQNNRIVEIKPDGSLVGVWGGLPLLDRPIGVAVDTAGNVFALNPIRDDIVEFSHSGSVVRTIGAPGVLPGQLSQPTSLAIDTHNALYVLDYGNERIQKVVL